MRVTVELSGESLPLAMAELEGACEALGGRSLATPEAAHPGRTVDVELPDVASARALAGRLAFAYRCIVFRGSVDTVRTWWTEAGRSGGSAAIRWQGHAHRGEGDDPLIAELAKQWIAAGGRIDLKQPQRRFWLREGTSTRAELGEEVGAIDRRNLLSRRLSRLPFRRPVALDPRLARASVNLARVRPGDRVVDPFVGTGALLAEAALLGARVTGVDVDPEMIRGAARNFEHLGVEAESWIAGDAAEVASDGSAGLPFDALVTDVPYGRSSGTQGEPVARLLRRALPLWAARVRKDGRVVIVSAGEFDPLSEPWRRIRSVPVRQHRSLTRLFSVYERFPVSG
jgi:tRNA (guanine10-N2)-dimethyltransferase